MLDEASNTSSQYHRGEENLKNVELFESFLATPYQMHLISLTFDQPSKPPKPPLVMNLVPLTPMTPLPN